MSNQPPSNGVASDGTVMVPVRIENVSLEILMRLNGPNTREKFEHCFELVRKLRDQFGANTLLDELSACLVGEIESVRIRGANHGGQQPIGRNQPGSLQHSHAPLSATSPAGAPNAGGAPHTRAVHHGIPQGNQPYSHGSRPSIGGIGAAPGAPQFPHGGNGGNLHASNAAQTVNPPHGGTTQALTGEQASKRILESQKFQPGTMMGHVDPKFLEYVVKQEAYSLTRGDYEAIIIYLTWIRTQPKMATQVTLADDNIRS